MGESGRELGNGYTSFAVDPMEGKMGTVVDDIKFGCRGVLAIFNAP